MAPQVVPQLANLLPKTLPKTQADWEQLLNALQQWAQTILSLAPQGVYEPPFQSGSVQVMGPNGTPVGYGSFQFGLLLPNASGIPCEGILVGGAGQKQAVYITDEQLSGMKGIDIIRSAGDASQTPGTDGGGDLLDFAGGTQSGQGGQAKYQGGTSVHGRAGDSVLHGGNSTDGTPGNAVTMPGETGATGSSTNLFMLRPVGSTTFGTVSILVGDGGGPPGGTTIPIIDFLHDGSIYLYLGGGFGTAGQTLHSGGPGASCYWA